jgi:hypothetical protein
MAIEECGRQAPAIIQDHIAIGGRIVRPTRIIVEGNQRRIFRHQIVGPHPWYVILVYVSSRLRDIGRPSIGRSHPYLVQAIGQPQSIADMTRCLFGIEAGHPNIDASFTHRQPDRSRRADAAEQGTLQAGD